MHSLKTRLVSLFCPKSKSWAVTTFASPDLISSNKRTKTFKPRAVGNSSTHPVH